MALLIPFHKWGCIKARYVNSAVKPSAKHCWFRSWVLKTMGVKLLQVGREYVSNILLKIIKCIVSWFENVFSFHYKRHNKNKANNTESRNKLGCEADLQSALSATKPRIKPTVSKNRCIFPINSKMISPSFIEILLLFNPFSSAKARNLGELCNPITRQAIELDSYPNHPRIQQVL